MKKFLFVLIAIIVGIAAIGYMLPVSHTVSRQLVLPQPAEKVWITITDFVNNPQWREDLKQAVQKESTNGDILWTEIYKDGDSLTFKTVIENSGRKLVRTIVDEDIPFGGNWTYEIDSIGSGTELTITEHGEVYNPIFRFLSRFVVGHETSLERYLADLKKHLAT